jgi:hypothetical protein
VVFADDNSTPRSPFQLGHFGDGIDFWTILDQRTHSNRKVRFRSAKELLLAHEPNFDFLTGFSGHGVDSHGLCRSRRHAATSRNIQTACAATPGHNSIPARCTMTPR